MSLSPGTLLYELFFFLSNTYQFCLPMLVACLATTDPLLLMLHCGLEMASVITSVVPRNKRKKKTPKQTSPIYYGYLSMVTHHNSLSHALCRSTTSISAIRIFVPMCLNSIHFPLCSSVLLHSLSSLCQFAQYTTKTRALRCDHTPRY